MSFIQSVLYQRFHCISLSLCDSDERVKDLTSQCEEEGRRRGEGEGEMRRGREKTEDLERQVQEGREREEGLRGELQAMREVRPHPLLLKYLLNETRKPLIT